MLAGLTNVSVCVLKDDKANMQLDDPDEEKEPEMVLCDDSSTSGFLSNTDRESLFSSESETERDEEHSDKNDPIFVPPTDIDSNSDPDSECEVFQHDHVTRVSESEESEDSVVYPPLVQNPPPLGGTLDSTQDSSITVQSAGEKKAYFCAFCRQPQKRLPTHLLTMHGNEEIVGKYYTCKDGKMKSALLTKIRNHGNHLHNCEVLEGGKGVMVVIHRPTFAEWHTPRNYVPCPDCYGYFRKSLMYRHACPLAPDDQKIKETSRVRKVLDDEEDDSDHDGAPTTQCMGEQQSATSLRQPDSGFLTTEAESATTDIRHNTTDSSPAVTSDPTNDADTDVTALTAFQRSLMLTDEQTDLAVEIQMYIYYVSVLFAVPLLIINIIVFLQRSMRSGTSPYVIGLSVAQLYYVVTWAGAEVYKASLEDLTTSKMYWVYFGYMGAYGGNSAKRGGYLLLCLVSVERLYAIVRPLHARTFFLSKRSLPVVCCALFLSFLWHVYLPCRNVVLPAGVNAKGQTVYRTFETELYRKTKDVNDAFSLAAKIVLSFSTLLLQLLLNVLTICALRRHNMAAKRVQSSADDAARRHRERQMTVTILAATISYVILSIPSAVHNLCYTLFPYQYSTGSRYSNLYQVTNGLSRNLSTFGAGIDFVCFLALSSAYRREFFKLFGCRARNQPSHLKENQTETERVET